MILHNVPYNPDIIEITTSSFCAKGFFESDLYVGNMLTSPCCSKECICEAKNQKIFDHFFTEVMVDAESFLFRPDWREGSLQLPRRFKIVAEWFFNLY